MRRFRLSTSSPFDKISGMLKFTIQVNSKAVVEVRNVFGQMSAVAEGDKPTQTEFRLLLESFDNGSAKAL